MSHGALELNLKNEKEFFKRTVRRRAFKAEWKAPVPRAYGILGNLRSSVGVQRTKEQGVRLRECQLLTVF